MSCQPACSQIRCHTSFYGWFPLRCLLSIPSRADASAGDGWSPESQQHSSLLQTVSARRCRAGQAGSVDISLADCPYRLFQLEYHLFPDISLRLHGWSSSQCQDRMRRGQPDWKCEPAESSESQLKIRNIMGSKTQIDCSHTSRSASSTEYRCNRQRSSSRRRILPRSRLRTFGKEVDLCRMSFAIDPRNLLAFSRRAEWRSLPRAARSFCFSSSSCLALVSSSRCFSRATVAFSLAALVYTTFSKRLFKIRLPSSVLVSPSMSPS